MGSPAESLFPEERKALSVTDLTRRIKKILEDNLRFVWVAGEISNFKSYPSGHLYFTLKDEESQISCVIWKGNALRLPFEPENGLEVLAYGKVDVYLQRGQYQLIVERMEPRGAGALALKFEQLKRKLADEGLFETTRKRPLPFLPRTVAIVTSRTGAVIQDMLRTLAHRCPIVNVVVYPVKVQGDGAAEEVAEAIAHLNSALPDTDVMIVGRGGGSIEDLWAFNEEVVARAIYASKIPVVSAVGHETDTTIADFVADVRAKTPTDAAVLVVPPLSDLVDGLADLDSKLRRALRSRADLARSVLEGFRTSHALMEPAALAGRHAQRLDELHARLGVGLTSMVSSTRERLGVMERTMSSELGHLAKSSREKTEGVARHLEAVSPVAVLGRGYSITSHEGRVVRKSEDVKPGDAIDTRLGEGTIRSRVE
ncbi:MAG TPA: exodeoxyribonuclease VII large subunit [Planctomycetota bacterium]|nr:exodeoxyribonuclease VII large subunit [Planctomycetota bacterium]